MQRAAAHAAFEATLAKEGAAINRDLAALKLEPIAPLTREGWEARGR